MRMSKKIVTTMIVATLGAVAVPSAYAATGTASVEIAAALTIGNASPNLSFGVVTPAAVAGSAQVLGNNTISMTNATSTGGTITAAQFAITGQGTLAYLVDTSASDTVLTGPGTPGTDMAISYTSYSVNDSATYATAYTAPNNLVAGADTLRVGGTLTIGTSAAQTAGTYSGNMVVTVVYQ